MTIEEFVEKAIEGGWIPKGMENTPETRDPLYVMCNYFHQPTFLLDPKAWQAVGKVEEWSDICIKPTSVDRETLVSSMFVSDNLLDTSTTKKVAADILRMETWPKWQAKMFEMTHALIEGKTIEEFISSL